MRNENIFIIHVINESLFFLALNNRLYFHSYILAIKYSSFISNLLEIEIFCHFYRAFSISDLTATNCDMVVCHRYQNYIGKIWVLLLLVKLNPKVLFCQIHLLAHLHEVFIVDRVRHRNLDVKLTHIALQLTLSLSVQLALLGIDLTLHDFPHIS